MNMEEFHKGIKSHSFLRQKRSWYIITQTRANLSDLEYFWMVFPRYYLYSILSTQLLLRITDFLSEFRNIENLDS